MSDAYKRKCQVSKEWNSPSNDNEDYVVEHFHCCDTFDEEIQIREILIFLYDR